MENVSKNYQNWNGTVGTSNNNAGMVFDAKVDAYGTAHQNIVKFKTLLVNRFPKYHCLLNKVKIVDCGDKVKGGRGCTNGQDTVWLNAGMSVEEGVTVLAHELEHVKENHCDKWVEDFELWNKATDADINDDLKAQGMHVPQNMINVDGARNMGAQKIYEEMLLYKKEGIRPHNRQIAELADM